MDMAPRSWLSFRSRSALAALGRDMRHTLFGRDHLL